MYDWITIMRYSKTQLINTLNKLYSLKPFHITPLPPHTGHYLSVLEAVIVERFDCSPCNELVYLLRGHNLF